MRYTRQVRLAEVGEAGQARLHASEVAVREDGVAGRVEATYLAAAGVGALCVRDAQAADAARAVDASVRVRVEASSRDEASLPSLDALHLDSAARDVAAGAWRALDAIREILGVNRNRTGDA